MKKIIEGKRYDTETAEMVCDVYCGAYQGDFTFHDTQIYRTKAGAWFLAGEGGPMSMWAKSTGNGNERSGGHGIRPVAADEALEILEQANAIGAIEKHFADHVQDA